MLTKSLLAFAAVLHVTLAAPTPDGFVTYNNTLIEDSHALKSRAQDPAWQCKFSLFKLEGKCSGTSPPSGSISVGLGTDPKDPVRHDRLGQQIGGASPCYNVSTIASSINGFWLTDDTCAHADKSRYDVSTAQHGSAA